jgi:hypothetical protein
MVTDAEISGDRNVMKIEAKKILQCKDLTIEIQHMWHVKTKVIPVIISHYIIYFPSVDPYRITKFMDMEMVTFLGRGQLELSQNHLENT